MLPVNEARGEVAVTVEGIELVVAAQNSGVAELEAQLQPMTIPQILEALAGGSARVALAVLQSSCVVRGDANKARNALLALHGVDAMATNLAIATAVLAAFSHHAKDTPLGNGRGAKAKAKG